MYILIDYGGIHMNITDILVKNNIRVKGHIGTWYVIDSCIMLGARYYLLEHEDYGDEVPCIIIDTKDRVVLEDVYNGFDDLREHLSLI